VGSLAPAIAVARFRRRRIDYAAGSGVRAAPPTKEEEEMTGYDRATTSDREKMVRTAAMAVGAVFLLVGILGFIPGITTNYGSLSLAGHMSDAKLLGIFQVSILHNLVHLLFGVAGLVLARRTPTAISYLIVGGVVYLGIWLYGLLVSDESLANFVPVNTADDWLHLFLGIGMVGLGVLGRSAVRDRGATRPV
jgi:hypothetical protein